MLAHVQAGVVRVLQGHEASHVDICRVISEAAIELTNAKDAAENDLDTGLFESFTR